MPKTTFFKITARLPRFRADLLTWYAAHRRPLPWRQSRDPYRIWVSEVMLQQTQVATVIPYFEKWLQVFPDIAALATAPIDQVLKSWEGLGYYSRARNFHRAAGEVVARHNGEIPRDYAAFRALSGVGDYTAAAVLSIAFGLPYAVVDGNVKRVLARLLVLEAAANDPGAKILFQEKADQILDRNHPGDFNQALMELGATVCKPRTPDCPGCPVRVYCAGLHGQMQTQLPNRLAAKKTPLKHQVAVVPLWENQVVIRRRPAQGLLGGLWEFPVVERAETEPAKRVVGDLLNSEFGPGFDRLTPLGTVKHAYTHFKIEVSVFLAEATDSAPRSTVSENGKWINISELETYPFSKYNLRIIELLRKHLDPS